MKHKLFYFLFLVVQTLMAQDLVFNRFTETNEFKPLRTRSLAQPLFFTEVQNYRLVENYLHFWNDRPLFHNSSWRGQNSYKLSSEFNVDLAKSYGLDGFVVLGSHKKLLQEWVRILNYIDSQKNPQFCGMMGSGYRKNVPEDFCKLFMNNYRATARSPHSLRINGKIVVWGYHPTSMTKKDFDKLRDLIKKENLPEPLFFSEANDTRYIHTIFARRGKLSPYQIKQLREEIIQTLREADGIVVSPYGRNRLAQGEYSARTGENDFFIRYTRPILLELLSQKEFANKLVGVYIYRGYVNNLSGNIQGEYGTSSFRNAMTETLKINPDIYVFFEWNEANENTHYQPTVKNGCALKRILRYYMAQITGRELKPIPGDNLTLPNVIFSSRQVVRLGEKAEFEIANFPDQSKAQKFTAQLSLKNAEGKLIKRFNAESFDRSEFKALKIEIPTVQLSRESVLIPELDIVENGKHNVYTMRHMRLDASVCTNYKEAIQPIREFLPADFKFEIKDNQLKAEVKSTQKLRSFELLVNENEVAAAQEDQIMGIPGGITIRGKFMTFQPLVKKISFEVTGSPQWHFRRDNYRTGPDKITLYKNQKTTLNYWIPFYYPEYFFIRYQPTAKAKLKIVIDGFPDFEIKLTELEKLQRFYKAYPQSIRLNLEIARNLFDIPAPLNANQAALQYRLDATPSTPQALELRAISMDGHIQRKFIGLREIKSHKLIAQPVMAVEKKAIVSATIPQNYRRDFNFQFSPSHGDMLWLPDYPEFSGEFGGGFNYIEPFNRPRPQLLSHMDKKQKSVPQWVKENNQYIIKFDGVANYINFPRETLPYGAYTIEFEIKPERDKTSEVLLRNFSYHCGGINLYRYNNNLTMVFTCRIGNNKIKTHKYDTNLKIPTNQWSKIKVERDLNKIVFTVNGQSKVLDFPHQGYFYKPLVFGGHNIPHYLTPDKNTKFFGGYLKSLRIIHGVDQ